MKDLNDFILERLKLNKNTKLVLPDPLDDDSKDHINYGSDINKFQKACEQCGVFMNDVDGGGISYITITKHDIAPEIAIEIVDDDCWKCYLDDEEDGSIWLATDEEGTADEEIDNTQFIKHNKYQKYYTFCYKNARLLAKALLKFKKYQK